MANPPKSGRQYVRCTGKSKTSGVQCKNWAILGHHVCRFHGGAVPGVKTVAARNMALREARAMALRAAKSAQAAIGDMKYDPIEDPYSELGRIVSEKIAVKDMLVKRIAAIQDVRWKGESEQVRGELQAYMAMAAQITTDLNNLAKLQLDERRVRVKEFQVVKITGAVTEVLRRRGLDGLELEKAKREVGQLLRSDYEKVANGYAEPVALEAR